MDIKPNLCLYNKFYSKSNRFITCQGVSRIRPRGEAGGSGRGGPGVHRKGGSRPTPMGLVSRFTPRGDGDLGPGQVPGFQAQAQGVYPSMH